LAQSAARGAKPLRESSLGEDLNLKTQRAQGRFGGFDIRGKIVEGDF